MLSLYFKIGFQISQPPKKKTSLSSLFKCDDVKIRSSKNKYNISSCNDDDCLHANKQTTNELLSLLWFVIGKYLKTTTTTKKRNNFHIIICKMYYEENIFTYRIRMYFETTMRMRMMRMWMQNPMIDSKSMNVYNEYKMLY